MLHDFSWGDWKKKLFILDRKGTKRPKRSFCLSAGSWSSKFNGAAYQSLGELKAAIPLGGPVGWLLMDSYTAWSMDVKSGTSEESSGKLGGYLTLGRREESLWTRGPDHHFPPQEHISKLVLERDPWGWPHLLWFAVAMVLFHPEDRGAPRILQFIHSDRTVLVSPVTVPKCLGKSSSRRESWSGFTVQFMVSWLYWFWVSDVSIPWEHVTEFFKTPTSQHRNPRSGSGDKTDLQQHAPRNVLLHLHTIFQSFQQTLLSYNTPTGGQSPHDSVTS